VINGIQLKQTSFIPSAARKQKLTQKERDVSLEVDERRRSVCGVAEEVLVGSDDLRGRVVEVADEERLERVVAGYGVRKRLEK